MSDSIRKFLEIAGIVVVTLTLLGIVFLGLQKAGAFTDIMYKSMGDMTTTLEEDKYTKYDGWVGQGDDVIAAVKYLQNGDPICITVATTGGDVVFGYTDSSLTTKVDNTTTIANCLRKGSSTYISPSAKYIGKVERNETDNSIWGVTFTFFTE